MNDRTLRNITIGCGAKANGVERKDGFNITVASEIMAALCLADDLMDLKKRFGKCLWHILMMISLYMCMI